MQKFSITLMTNLLPMIITCLLAGSVLAILAPLGTNQFATFPRFGFWIGLCIVGGLGASIVNLIENQLGRTFKPWQCALVQSFTASIAVAGVMSLLPFYLQSTPNLQQNLTMLFYIWVISASISGIGLLITIGKNATAETPSRAALYERLSPHLRGSDIYALAAEDHYVRVITSHGDELILMRLSDAVSEISPLKGLPPHRSWWVTEAGVATIKKSEITLHSKHIVPISRTGMKVVRNAGWK